MVSDILHRISEKGDAHSLFGKFLASPARMIGSVEVGLRMGHHAEKSPRLIADPGDGLDRPVGIEGIFHDRPIILRIRVLKRDKIPLLQLALYRSVGRDEFSFAVADREGDPLEAL